MAKGKLSAARRRAIAVAVKSGEPVATIASRMGISTATVRYWSGEPKSTRARAARDVAAATLAGAPYVEESGDVVPAMPPPRACANCNRLALDLTMARDKSDRLRKVIAALL